VIPRFLVPDLEAAARRLELPHAEGHHLTHVLRLGAGAEIRVFDGRGAEWVARVSGIERRRVVVEVLHAVAPAAESPVPVVLAQSVLKPEAMDRVVRDAVMLGVSALAPLVSARVTVPVGKRTAQLQERWTRIAVASVKQCGRAVVPAVAPPVGIDAWLGARAAAEGAAPGVGGEPASGASGVRLVLVEPGAGPAERLDLAGLRHDAAQDGAVLAVGPEGGWTPAEIQGFEAHGFHSWSLGARTLRAETATLAALSVLLYEWE
jgi:16S rRNA (uracil1498-N3)-methyltransferase